MKRRELLVGASAAAGGTLAVSGSAAAQDGVDYGGWLDDVGNFDGTTVDATGQSEVTVEVGAQGNGGSFAFEPPAVRVDPGTDVTFEWVSNTHNVVPESQPEGAGWEGHDTIENSGYSFTSTFETEGIYKYFCRPHLSAGMKGAIVVGQVQQDGGDGEAPAGGEVDPEEMGVPFQAHYVGLVTILAMIVSLVFVFFVLKYGESAHTSSPERK